MCGIAGICNLTSTEPIAVETLERMTSALYHRGPDEFGIYRDAWAGLGSARLSIIDLSGGQQPISNEDGTVWIVFNGEIFNYLELRQDLEARGHRFATHTDTEVVVHAYEEFGTSCLTRFNGQFAIALWDSGSRSLFLARDRVGIRPLFYSQESGRLIFGSEIKSILTVPGIQAHIDPLALRQLFTFWAPLPPRSIFQGINEVPPGHFLLAADGQTTIRPYWSLNFQEELTNRTDQDVLDEFEALLIDATRIRLRADVPVGAYLSGGLDSSVTSALIRGYTDSHLDTFSIAFENPEYNEKSFQQTMASFLGTSHHEVVISDGDIGRIFPDVIWHTEAPILRTAPAPMYLLSDLVHQQNYKVVLTGEGADEILAGYDIFKEMQIRRFWARDPESVQRPLLFKRLYPDIPRLNSSRSFLSAFFKKDLERTGWSYYSHQIRWGNTARAQRFLLDGDPAGEYESLLQDLPVPVEYSGWSPLGQAQYLEMATFLSPYLLSSQGDRMAMAHSVEGRYPFLDYRVIEFCGRLASNRKLRGLNEKWLLRKLGQKLVPAEIWRRTKRPYRAPIQPSFFQKESQPGYVSELLSPEALRSSGYFQPAAVEGLARKASSASRLSEMEEMALVGILSTQLVDHLFVRQQHSQPAMARLQPLKVVDRVGVGA